GLARAVGPEHGGDRAALGGEAHAVDDGTTVVALDEVVHEHGRGGHPAILGGGRAPPGPRTAAATRVSRTPHRARLRVALLAPEQLGNTHVVYIGDAARSRVPGARGGEHDSRSGPAAGTGLRRARRRSPRDPRHGRGPAHARARA